MKREFYFRIPVTLSLRVQAESEADATEAARTWQDHANGWEEFTSDYAPAEHLPADELPAGAEIIDATVYVECSGEPFLTRTEAVAGDLTAVAGKAGGRPAGDSDA